MIDDKCKLNEEELSNISAGKDVDNIVNELIPLTSQYPEIVEIIDAYEKNDYGKLLMLLQEFAIAHPELASIFDD